MALYHRALFCLFVLFSSSAYCASDIIQQYVDAAIIKGASSLTIPPGIYVTSLNSYGVHLNITNVNDFTIFAYNVTLICTVRARAIDITNCVNVAIYGLVVDYDPLTFTQGTIVDLNNYYLDLKIHDGYPAVPWGRINVVDPKTMFFKDGMGFMWDISANLSAPGVVRVYRSGGGGFYTAQVGDYATLAGGPDGDYACHAIAINFCSSTTLVDVTVHCAPGFGLAEWGGEGALTLEKFQLIPGPMPTDATMPRLQTSSWDGIEHTSMKKGPFVNNMVVELAGDDTWSTVSDCWQIAEIDASNRQITFNGGAPYILYSGDNLRLRNEMQYPNEEVIVEKIDMESYASLPLHAAYCSRCAAKALRKITSSPNFTVSVDRDIPTNWQEGDFLYSNDRQATGFILQNSYVRSKGRGALVKAPHGLIQNNYFYGGTAGVEVSPEVSGDGDSAANVGYDLVVRNNTIVHTGYHETFDDPSYGADGAIAIFGYAGDAIRQPDTFLDMVIDGNSFNDINGINIGIAASDGVLISNNTFWNTLPVNYSVQGLDFGFNNGYVVFLQQSSNITLSGNVVYGASSPYKLGNLFVSNVTSLYKFDGGIIQDD